MKNIRFFLIIPAVVIVTLFSIYFTTNAESYASKSEKNKYTYSDSTQSNNSCCKEMTNCSGMDNNPMHNHMSTNKDNSNMNMNKGDCNMDMNSGKHQHNDNRNDSKNDNSSGCMRH